MSEHNRDREPNLHWSMAADYSREDLERKFRALGYDDDPREPVMRRRSQIIDVDAEEQQLDTDHGRCTARPRAPTVNHNTRAYREGLQCVADQLGLDVADLIAADAEIYG